MSDEDRRVELPEGLTTEQERAVISALERHFLRESPHPNRWVLAGRLEANGIGSLQARHYADEPWTGTSGAPFPRIGVPPFHGRGDAR